MPLLMGYLIIDFEGCSVKSLEYEAVVLQVVHNMLYVIHWPLEPNSVALFKGQRTWCCVMQYDRYDVIGFYAIRLMRTH